ncbi:amino acid/amide ABC transporter ATP-binding protein 2, HAAT family [Thermomonospora echinospora]|uniref:Amino acid/amide ABC transporter ATP-binding protein 2, HAAT family n=1 Tax=Thermomonospora echinospora TaxID=1992 RepID=A0A1H6AHG7_9ACTN|nr:ABC transporter ATP-binding protein [Thermomonospora echinospora]SEG48203.1 amino acid/amide ABC transporter ATP-binding protein 2, HAAT family [Thermomonospora echinospora]
MILELKDVHAGYGSLSVIRGVSLTVEPGQIVTILGPNGAGKTTLLKSLSGLIRPTGGSVILSGTDITRLPAHRRARQGLLHVPEGRGIFDDLTVEDNLRLGGQRLDRSTQDRRADEMYEMFPVLSERRRSRAGLLSGGQQQILAVARGLMSRPKLLMIDEPTMGLAPIMVSEIIASLQGVLDSGTSILLAEQNAAVATRVATTVQVLSNGELSEHSADTGDADAIFDAYLA